MIFTNVDTTYRCLCSELLQRGKKVRNTLELTDVSIAFPCKANNIVSVRDISVEYLLGELVWYFSGRNDTAFISKYAKRWKEISDDGVTANSAYGYTLMKEHGFNQLETIIELLLQDKYSRRAVLNINKANKNVITTKDEPCTICLQFLIRDNELHCTTYMRSNDIWWGFPYDVAFFTLLQRYIAYRLRIPVGYYRHVATSLHVYIDKLEKIREPEPSIKYFICAEKLPQFAKNVIETNTTKTDIERIARIQGVLKEV